MDMRVFLTGGSGFIGSHILEHLIAQDEVSKVTVLDLWQNPELNWDHPKVKFHKMSVLHDGVDAEMKWASPTHIIHLAAILGTSETITTYDVEEVAQTNIMGTIKMLKLSRKHRVQRMLVPTTPDVTWLNPYKITKAAISKFCKMFWEQYSLPVVTMQLGNVYGARERWLECKKAPYTYEKIVPTLLMAALQDKPFKIYDDGRQKSEYIYVKDVAEAFWRALKTPNLGGNNIPVGRGFNYSVMDIVEAAAEVLGHGIETEHVSMRRGEEHTAITLDPAPMRDLLDYRLMWPLDHGLKETLPYYREHVS